MQEFEQHPKTVKVSVPGVADPVNVMISGGMLLQWAVSPGTHTAAQVPAASTPSIMATRRASRPPGPLPGSIPPASASSATDSSDGVSCAEWVPYESEQAVEDAGQRAFPTFPASIHANAPNLQFMRSNCDAWNVSPVAPVIRDVTESNIPTLVISAQYDAQTAPSFGSAGRPDAAERDRRRDPKRRARGVREPLTCRQLLCAQHRPRLLRGPERRGHDVRGPGAADGLRHHLALRVFGGARGVIPVMAIRPWAARVISEGGARQRTRAARPSPVSHAGADQIGPIAVSPPPR